MHHSGSALIDPRIVFEKIKLANGMKVADFGCGRTGHFVLPSSKEVGNEGVVYAVDIVKDALQIVQNTSRDQGCDNVRIVWSDIEIYGKTAIPVESLDAIFFVNVLFLLKDRQTAIKEASRLLKKNGFLVIIDWRKSLGPLGPNEHQLVLADSVIDWFKQNRLNLTENSMMSDYHYLLIAQKI